MLLFAVGAAPVYGEVAFEWKQGTRTDVLEWSIGGVDSQPNILSELTWDVGAYEYSGAELLWISTKGWAWRLSGGYGEISEGKNRDSDYWGNDRTLEFSRSENVISGDWVVDGAISVGYPLSSPLFPIFLLPQAGFGVHGQKLRLTDGWQVLQIVATETGYQNSASAAIEGLDSTYRSTWTGPFLALYGKMNVIFGCAVHGSLEHHWALYRGKGVWNLRDDIGTFHDSAHGRGWVWNAGVDIPFSGVWRASIDYSLQQWKTREGTHITPVLEEGQWVAIKQPFNAANLRSEAVTLSFGCAF